MSSSSENDFLSSRSVSSFLFSGLVKRLNDVQQVKLFTFRWWNKLIGQRWRNTENNRKFSFTLNARKYQKSNRNNERKYLVKSDLFFFRINSVVEIFIDFYRLFFIQLMNSSKTKGLTVIENIPLVIFVLLRTLVIQRLVKH